MGKQEYLAQVQVLLTGRMAPEEIARTLAYYEEYFDEAGPDRAAEIAEELGTPAELAHRVLGEGRMVKPEEVPRERRGLGGLWAALLALCAAPIALPLIAVAVGLVVVLAAVVICVVVAIWLGGGACVIVGFYVGARSFTLLFSGGMSTLMYYSGLGMLTAGIGLLLITLGLGVAELCFRGMIALVRRITRGREVQV